MSPPIPSLTNIENIKIRIMFTNEEMNNAYEEIISRIGNKKSQIKGLSYG